MSGRRERHTTRAHKWSTYDAGYRHRPPYGIPCSLRTGGRTRGDAPQANMVIAARKRPRQGSVDKVTIATLGCLRRHVPTAVPGIVFLSGGQNARLATAHLNAINWLAGPKPWRFLLRASASGIRRWRHGTGGPAGGPFSIGPAATARQLLGSIQMRWRRHRKALIIRRIAEIGAMTDAHAAHCRQFAARRHRIQRRQ